MEAFIKKTRYTGERSAKVICQAETGTSFKRVIRKMGISEQTFYRWKKLYGGLGSREVRRLKQLEEGNRRLKQMVVDQSFDKHMLQAVLSRKL